VLVEARIPGFDPRRDASALYCRLLERGTVRLWRNAAAGESFEPGGLDLDEEFHPRTADGQVERRITVLGVPSEGPRSFLVSALRPGQDHYVMRDTLSALWQRESLFDEQGLLRVRGVIVVG
jgi:hypothetical protein